MIGDEYAQISWDRAVETLSLAVGIRVIGCGELRLDTKDLCLFQELCAE